MDVRLSYVSLPFTLSQRILVSFRVLTEEIPKDPQGRPVFQLHQKGSGASGLSGKIIFGGKENPTQKCAQFPLTEFLKIGFRINNVHRVANEKNEKFSWIRVWLNHRDTGGNDMSPEDWGVAGEFVQEKLEHAFNSVTVYDNGGMFSINMVDPSNVTKFVLLPALFFSEKAGLKTVDNDEVLDRYGRNWPQVLREEEHVRAKLYPHPEVQVPVHAPNAMQLAFLDSKAIS